MRRPAISLIATTAVLLALASPVLGLQLGAAGTSSLPDGTVGQAGAARAASATSPAARPSRSPSSSTARPTTRRAQQGLARLRAELGGDRDFAAARADGRDRPAHRRGLRAAHRRAEQRTRLGRDRPPARRLRPAAFGAAADRVFVGGTPAEARDSFAVNGSWLPIVIAFVLTLSFVLLTARVPVDRDPADRDRRQPALGRRRLRDPRARLPGGRRRRPARLHQVERIDAWVPIFLFSVLFGLSMDYQVFLLSRIHERWAATGDTPGAIVHGVASTARLITGAAAIIIVVFTGFATGPARRLPGDGLRHRRSRSRSTPRSCGCCSSPPPCACSASATGTCPRWLAWLPNVQVEGPRPAPLRPAVLVRQYTGDVVSPGTAPAPPEPPLATSKER